MIQLEKIFEMLNDFWDVFRKYGKHLLREEEEWSELAVDLAKICERYAGDPQLEKLSSGLGACLYNYFYGEGVSVDGGEKRNG